MSQKRWYVNEANVSITHLRADLLNRAQFPLSPRT